MVLGQLSHPCGVAFCKEKEVIAVTEQDNHRVQLFTLHGEPSKMFGCQGSEEGKFLYPHHLTFNVKSLCLVSDCVNDRIQVFDKDGEYQSCFGEEGKEWLCCCFITVTVVDVVHGGVVVLDVVIVVALVVVIVITCVAVIFGVVFIVDSVTVFVVEKSVTAFVESFETQLLHNMVKILRKETLKTQILANQPFSLSEYYT